jgi:hypothetical protein
VYLFTVLLGDEVFEFRRNCLIISGEQLSKFFRVGAFFGEGRIHVRLALAKDGQFRFDGRKFFAQFTFFDGGLVGLQGDLRIEQGRLGEFEVSRQLLAFELGAVQGKVGLVELQARVFQFCAVEFPTSAADNITVGDPAATVGRTFFVKFIDPVESIDAFAYIGGQRLEVTQRIELLLQIFYVEQVFIQKVVMDKRSYIGQRAESQSFDDFGGEGIFELPEPVEQVDAIIFQTRKRLGAGSRRQGKMIEMSFEGASIEEAPVCIRLEEPTVVQSRVVNDEVHHIRRASILVGVNQRAVREERAVRIAEFESNHACRVTAQVTLTLGAQFAAHIAGKGALAARERCLVETYIPLPTDQGKLHRVENGGFARAVDAYKVGTALAIYGCVLEQVPVDEPNFGKSFHRDTCLLVYLRTCVPVYFHELRCSFFGSFLFVSSPIFANPRVEFVHGLDGKDHTDRAT